MQALQTVAKVFPTEQLLNLLALCLLGQAAAVAEKTAAPAQTRSEYDLITLTSFLLKVRHQPVLAINARTRLASLQGYRDSWVANRAAEARCHTVSACSFMHPP